MGGDDSHHGVLVSVRNAPTLCPSCDSILSASSWAMEADMPDPEPGDLTICLYCGELLMFDDDRCPTLKPTAEELKQGNAEQLKLSRQLQRLYTDRLKH